MNSRYKSSLPGLPIWAACLFFIGCKKFVEIQPPVNLIVTASVFNNDPSATAAQTMIYTLMQQNSESFNMSWNNGLLADELTNYSATPLILQYYTNSMVAVSSPGPWTNAYNYIYQANAIIQGLQKYSGVSAAAKQQLTGESKFIRAFWHFYLTNIYGDVPLVTSTDYTVNAKISRTPKAQVFQQIINDLKDAQNELNINYVDASDTTIATDRVRPTKWAATALLARAYLYTGDYANAEVQATSVINNTELYNLVPNLDSVFLANSPEAIWQLATPVPFSNAATPDGYGYILIAQPGTSGANSAAISPQLMKSFEVNDNRLTHWIGAYITSSPPIDTFYYPFKYKVYDSTVVTEYVMVLRLAEQYLIRAEARARQGNLTGAASAATDLDTIRRRAGLLNTTAVTQTDLLSAILHERQVELFTEWGHRWFDLIRTNNANAVMGVGGVTSYKGGTWNSNWQLYPIPQTERSADPNLTQNPGYN
jgi:starch-binding outer membrane protein, SusD/RagB family